MSAALCRVVIIVGLLAGAAVHADAQLVVLTTSGETRDGLTVVRAHPDPGPTLAVLTRGYSGRLLHLYALEQEFLRRTTGRAPQPAYLVLSDRQGGFPRFGFYLGGKKEPDVAWIDLHRDSDRSGRFGAMDQVFPHELLHVIVRQLAGEPPASGGNQVHAIGVRTDPVIAFDEGFAEHAQVLAVDDDDASADTHGLRGRSDIRERADRDVETYARDLARPWWPAEPSRLRFLFWFSRTEQVQRYYAVKANLFAHEPELPARLAPDRDPYRAYLLWSVMPGRPDSPPKTAAVALSCEGVVAHLFWRVVQDPALRARYRDDAFYRRFGVARADVVPFDNVYLKLFAVLHETRPATAAEALRGWVRVHPDDAADIGRIAREALLGQAVPDAPEIWLANDALQTGTSLFDQYRGLPRPHTFDANAAAALDWRSVPGVTGEAAARLLADAPYPSLDALLASPALAPGVREHVARMAAGMRQVHERAASAENSLSLWPIARAYLGRLAALVLAATTAGAWLACRVGVRRRWTAALMALTATLIVVAFAWVITSPWWYPLAAPVVLGGVPWSLWRLGRARRLEPAAIALASWAVVALPAVVLTARW